jgi:hypothetical protein
MVPLLVLRSGSGERKKAFDDRLLRLGRRPSPFVAVARVALPDGDDYDDCTDTSVSLGVLAEVSGRRCTGPLP